jgi:DNA-binding MarR family transcriptional regulator
LLAQLFKEYDITSVQYNILRILRGAAPEPLTVGEVKARVMFSNTDVTRLMDRMAKKSIIIREQCPDNRRKVHIRISEKGISLLQELKPAIEKTLHKFYSAEISEEEATKTIALLTKIRNTNGK